MALFGPLLGRPVFDPLFEGLEKRHKESHSNVLGVGQEVIKKGSKRGQIHGFGPLFGTV